MFLETINIKKIYDNNSIPFEALTNINISLEKGKIGALVGASGSGKTTLLNIIGALDHATHGEVIIEEQTLSNKTSHELALFRRKNLGFIFQSYNLIPVLTVYENVALALFNMSEKEKKDRVMNILKVVGLKDKVYNFPNQLSGGQQQRVSIARALVKVPKILLADEPTANLDSYTGQQILDLMAAINEKVKITMIFSTHDSRVLDIAHKVYTMQDGSIIKEINR